MLYKELLWTLHFKSYRVNKTLAINITYDKVVVLFSWTDESLTEGKSINQSINAGDWAAAKWFAAKHCCILEDLRGN